MYFNIELKESFDLKPFISDYILLNSIFIKDNLHACCGYYNKKRVTYTIYIL